MGWRFEGWKVEGWQGVRGVCRGFWGGGGGWIKKVRGVLVSY